MKEITIKTGKETGLTSVIMAGTHGNELCGVKAFEKILPKLQIEKGSVYFLLGNPKAIKENKRFTEYNLNRLFSFRKKYSPAIRKTYEYKRAQFLKTFLDKADALLDIHSTTNKSEPFIICERNANKITNLFSKDFKRIVYGFNEVEPGGTDGYMIDQGKIGITVECGQHEDMHAQKNAEQAIKAFLEARGHIKKKIKSTNKTKIKTNIIKRKKVQMHELYYSKTNSFKLVKKMDDFYEAKKGELIGVDGTLEIRTKKSCIVVFAHDRNKKGEEAFLLGKKV